MGLEDCPLEPQSPSGMIKKNQQPRKRPRHCSYIQGNQLGLERTPKRLLEHDVDILKKKKKKRRCYLRKVKIYSLYGIFPHYPDVQDT